MNLYHKRLNATFAAMLAATLIWPIFFPSVALLFFSPYLVILYYQKDYLPSLWHSLGCGLILDLLSSHQPMGLHAVSFCLTTSVLYRQKRHFFADSISTLPVMTFLFSLTATFLQSLFMDFVANKVRVSMGWVVSELLVMPAMDALVGFAVFILPWLILGKRERKGKEYFL